MLKKVQKIGIWIFGTYLFYLLAFLIFSWLRGATGEELTEYFFFFSKSLFLHPVGWLLLFTPYLLFNLLRYLYLGWKKQGYMIFFKRLCFSVVLPVLFLYSGLNVSKWYTQSESFDYTWDTSFEHTGDTISNRYAIDGKQRGMHFFGRGSLKEEMIDDLLKTNTEWITLVPFGGQEDYNSNRVGRRSGDYSTWTRRDSSFMKKIEKLKAHGFYIMMKPHIWMYSPSSGKWRSDIKHDTPEDWAAWAESYRNFILHYARMSSMYDLDLFCVGAELHQTVKQHPEYWEQLIVDIRKIYNGKITYAANWNAEMEDVKFWDQLDFIGIQAYFPLTSNTEPSVREIQKGWRKHLDKITKLHKQYNKPILFSELGYKSTLDAAITPWEWANSTNSLYKKVSYQTQANCYEAFFKTFWDKEWFAGVHFWEWQANHRSNKKKNINFTPQNKPAENIMSRWFAQISSKNENKNQ